MKWTSELLDKLRALYRTGKTFGEIAEQVGCSRNAAIGKARRSNFAARQPGKREVVSVLPPVVPVKKPKPRIEKPDQDYRCTIWELTDSRCRYPLWDHGAKKCEYYCGAPGASLSSSRPYCSVHMQVCITHKHR